MSRTGPIKWNATKDREIAAAIARQADVHRRWVETQAEARAAVEAVATARAEDESKRADLVAAGKDDPGAADVSELERAADEAAQRRDILGEGFKRSRAAALRLADEREAAWTAEAETALGAATGALVGAIDVLATALDAWQAARAEVMLAQSSALRERGRLIAGTLTVDRLRGANGDPMALPDVIAALRELAATPAPGAEPVVEAEPERISDTERREIAALGGVILPSRE